MKRISKKIDERGKPYFCFAEGNKITAFQDYKFWDGIPAAVHWYVRRGLFLSEIYLLIADGYGLPGNYGNGALLVKTSTLTTAEKRLLREAQKHTTFDTLPPKPKRL